MYRRERERVVTIDRDRERERERPSKMAEVVSLMDIDDEENNNTTGNDSYPKPNKGKNVVIDAGVPNYAKATPWVEKYRPQSLADVAAHRDIVDTSNIFLSFSISYILGFLFIFPRKSVAKIK